MNKIALTQDDASPVGSCELAGRPANDLNYGLFIELR
jgi:hypothetical protein